MCVTFTVRSIFRSCVFLLFCAVLVLFHGILTWSFVTDSVCFTVISIHVFGFVTLKILVADTTRLKVNFLHGYIWIIVPLVAFFIVE